MIEFNTEIAACIIMTLGLMGLATNLTVAYAIRRSASFGYAFGTLCFSQLVADIGMCTVFSFLTGGISLIDPSWHSTYIGRRSGQLLIFFWEASIFTHFFAAINRAAAINFPLKYNFLFGKPIVTRCFIVIIWTISTIQAAPYTIPSCSMLFDPVSFTYAYGEGLCGEITEHYADKFTSITVVCVIGALDMTSFCQLVKLRATAVGSSHIHQHKRREVRFFFQACAQSALLMSTLVFFFYLVDLNTEDPWYVFITTTVIWMMVHCLDGLIVIIFNREVRSIIYKRFKGIRVSSIASIQSNTHPQALNTQTRASATEGALRKYLRVWKSFVLLIRPNIHSLTKCVLKEWLNGVQIPNVFFEVKDDFMYYASDRGILQLNLLNKEKRVFEYENLPETKSRYTEFLNGKLCLCYLSGAGKERFCSELEFNSEKTTVKCLDPVRLECGGFDNMYYRSRDVSVDQTFSKFICHKNNRVYNIPGLTLKNPVFVKGDRMYYIIKREDKLILNSFKLDDENENEELELNAACPTSGFGVGRINSFVFGDTVYFAQCGVVKVFCLHLSTLHVEEMSVGGLSEISNLWRCNYDEKTIYLTDFNQTTKVKLYKINVIEDQANDSTCRHCKKPSDNLKCIHGCGHSICEDCEKDILKQFVDTNGRQLNCPVLGCTSVVTLSKGESLPTRKTCGLCSTSGPSNSFFFCRTCTRDNFDFASKAMCGQCFVVNHNGHPFSTEEIRSEKENDKALTKELEAVQCSSCEKRIPKAETLQCGTCQGPDEPEAFLCAICALLSHRLHDGLGRVAFATEEQKNEVIERHTSRKVSSYHFHEADFVLAKEIAKQVKVRQTRFEETVSRLENNANRIRENRTLTVAKLNEEEAELKTVSDAAKKEVTELERWKNNVLETLRQ